MFETLSQFAMSINRWGDGVGGGRCIYIYCFGADPVHVLVRSESVGGFWPNLHSTIAVRGQVMTRIWWPWPNFQGHTSTVISPFVVHLGDWTPLLHFWFLVLDDHQCRPLADPEKSAREGWVSPYNVFFATYITETLPQEPAYSRGSVPVYLRKPITTCNFPKGVKIRQQDTRVSASARCQVIEAFRWPVMTLMIYKFELTNQANHIT